METLTELLKFSDILNIAIIGAGMLMFTGYFITKLIKVHASEWMFEAGCHLLIGGTMYYTFMLVIKIIAKSFGLI